MNNYDRYDIIVVGSGISGSVIAERFSSDNKKVLVIDKKNEIAGSVYDYYDESGILVQKYGPHIFHTNNKEVFDYLSMFTNWTKYEHKVLGKVNNTFVPIPFNFKSIDMLFDNSIVYKNKLLQHFKENQISIFDLENSIDQDLSFLKDFIYDNIFLNYTIKQWGEVPSDREVLKRVPINLSYDNKYFTDKYQYVPKDGYTKLINNMLSNSNIDILLNTDFNNLFSIKDNSIYINNQKYDGIVIYTGSVDELFNYKYGMLPYRSINFEIEELSKEFYQDVGVVNYPTKEEYFTRITEYKHITSKDIKINKTVIMKEYPCNYVIDKNMPFYPIRNDKNASLYKKYLKEVEKVNNLYITGRLGMYMYYNMDEVVAESLKLYEKIRGGKI